VPKRCFRLPKKSQAAFSPPADVKESVEPTALTELSLVRRALAGDHAAATALYDAHAPRLYAVMRRIALDDATAEDWAQEAWIRAFGSLASFRADARFGTWLYRIAFNTAMDLRRKAARRAAAPMDIGAQTVESGEDRVIARATVEAALARLPDSLRAVTVLHEIEGFSHEEIAEMLDIRPATSRSHLFKARVRLQHLLGAAPAVSIAQEESA